MPTGLGVHQCDYTSEEGFKLIMVHTLSFKLAVLSINQHS